MRALAVFLTAAFVGFAYLQINDPDPALWVTVYLVAAALTAAPARWPRFPAAALFGAAAVFLIAAALCWPARYSGVTGEMDATHPEIEEARESLGLGICAAALALLGVGRVRSGRRHVTTSTSALDPSTPRETADPPPRL